MRLLKYLAALSGILAATPALAWDQGGYAKVTTIEVSYMPNQIPFKIDDPIAGCPTSGWVFWYPTGANQAAKDQNAQAVLATLPTAKASDQQITVYIRTNGCVVEFLYLGTRS